ncbi:ABC transporter permease [Deferribacter thermophilus]|uniref:ABC transporter permease n=1 Tax=Deferribacter thermophilus TaxID=53573 RepID=UPI003C188B1D
MLVYILKRLLWTIPTIFGVSILVFAMVHLAPGDPALVMLGEHASKESVEKLRKDLGLDKPLYVQYLIFVKKAVKGDFGKSIKSRQDVIVEFWDRFPATVELTVVSMLFAIIIGIFAGIIASVKRYSIFDYTSMVGSLAGVSMPVFWLGLLLIYFFAVKLGWLPVSGRLSYEYYIDKVTGFYLIDAFIAKDYEAFWDALKHLILPGFALGTIPMALIARMTRSSMLDVLKEDYIKTAKAKGCSSFRVIMIHAFRNAAIPVVTIVGLMFGTLLAGAILTETTFSWPGIGKWLVNAVYQRDFPVVQCATLIIAVIFVVINLIVDIVYAFINPKVRLD